MRSALAKTVQSLAILAGFAASPAVGASIEPVEPDPAEAFCHAGPPNEASVCIGTADYKGDVCRAIETYASASNLPPAFFARLIWQESRFDAMAMSPAGAQGIAQFMPGTARLRGLTNAFHPTEALARSAEYLRFLEVKFGNLGMAAAAYNSGEARTERIKANGGVFPSETRAFVRIITGVPVETWQAEIPPEVDYTLKPEAEFQEACVEMAKAIPMPNLAPVAGAAEFKPWGVQIAQDFSPDVAQSAFDRVQARYPDLLGQEQALLVSGRNPSFGHRIRHSAVVGRDTREEAQALCGKLTAAGGSCIVRKN